MKKITAKINMNVLEKSYQFRNMLEKIQHICIPGTLNITRIGMRQVFFKIEDKFESNLDKFIEFEKVDMRSVVSHEPDLFSYAEAAE
jgi:hypothetical protein